MKKVIQRPFAGPKKRSILKSTRARIILVVSLVAGLAALLGNIRQVVDFFKDIYNPPGVKVVNISFTDSDSLDIQLRNTGKDISVVKEIRLLIKKKWVFLPDGIAKSGLQPSGNYNLLIDTLAAPGDQIERRISQQLEPGKADRFFLFAGPVQKEISGNYVYLTDLIVVCDEDDRTVRTSNVLVFLEDKQSVYYKSMDSIPTFNAVIAAAIDSTAGLRSSRLIAFLKSFKEE